MTAVPKLDCAKIKIETYLNAPWDRRLTYGSQLINQSSFPMNEEEIVCHHVSAHDICMGSLKAFSHGEAS